MKVVNLLVGGPKTEWPTDLKSDTKIKGPFVGVDRGALSLLEMGIKPIAAVGDFDSVSSVELQQIKKNVSNVYCSNPIKDETDTELGIRYVLKHFPNYQINVYGFSGGRLDQLMTNLLMVYKDPIKSVAEKITLIDRHNFVNFFLPGKYQITKISGMKYLDFVSLEKTKLTLPDEKYKLNNYEIKFPVSFSSNEFIGNHATFSFDSGILMVIQSSD
ncbi:thiamine diphosphokinase [Fructilactobacillus lindneri]|uniref:Thiamine diphosphokinase n=2 Tax=Fructilactobacillus lindneri TaxID=53444 RepID=A0A0R2JPI5_9LACO|nr:thiamine diphosphokinase [Fructilactobacillus lindneri]ANZ58219.1 thiamine pyrophosphokinase [Fructilactobacillus lindneri]ANZ59540.1 thiamine pyrophosphokinase [Fructilactobacillus lindneri]KRN79043.1 hypothetical protein IV52_GL000448 [Fructilactobacillus lindneri DSM 20690 = JCM 11027]POG98676.1 thiamine diphosphokinase [Fructilactobacillus lindneri]POH04064.1 thiamine diphosphokinase [Fructilactobacillus lindneri]